MSQCPARENGTAAGDGVGDPGLVARPAEADMLRTALGCVSWLAFHRLDLGDEAEAAARQRSDHRLRPAAIADRPTRRVDARAMVASDDAAPPDDFDQLIPRDGPVLPLHQKGH